MSDNRKRAAEEEGRGARARKGMAETTDDWTPLIVAVVLVTLFIVGVICCLPASDGRSLFWYSMGWITGEQRRRERALQEEEQQRQAQLEEERQAGQRQAKPAPQPSAAMLPSLPSLSSIPWGAL